MSSVELSHIKFWNLSIDETLSKLQTKEGGLSGEDAEKNITLYGPNIIHSKKINIFSLFIRQFTGNPLILVLVSATLISFLFGERISSYYIFAIIIVSILFGLWN